MTERTPLPRDLWLPCPACGTPLQVRPTHNDKPHWICDPCGVQLFVRKEAGIERIVVRLTGRATQPSGFWAGGG